MGNDDSGPDATAMVQLEAPISRDCSEQREMAQMEKEAVEFMDPLSCAKLKRIDLRYGHFCHYDDLVCRNLKVCGISDYIVARHCQRRIGFFGLVFFLSNKW